MRHCLRSLSGRIVLCCLVFATLTTYAAVAEEPTLTILPVSHSLTLAGLVENEPIQLQGALWVSLEGWPEDQNGPAFSLWLTEDLAASGGGARPDSRLSNLTLQPAEVDLANGRSTRVEITVKDVEWPGVYAGKLSYRVQGDEQLMVANRKALEDAAEADEKAQKDNATTKVGEDAVKAQEDAANLAKAAEGWKGEVMLTLDVRTKPRVIAIETELALNLVDCTSLCGLARMFLPDDTTPGPWPVELRNDSLAPVVITPRARISRKESLSMEGGFSVTQRRENAAAEMDITDPVVAIAEPAVFDFSIDRGNIGPGSYEGNLLFVARPSGEDALPGRGPDGAALALNRTDVSVHAKVDVRAGVFWVLFWVSVGIIAGRLNRQISTPEAQARLKLYDETVTFRDRIARLADTTLEQSLRDRLFEIRRDIEDLDGPDAEIRLALDLLADQVRLAEDLETEESKLDGLQAASADAAVLASIRKEIGQARQQVLGETVEPARESLERIREAIRSATGGGANAANVAAVLRPAVAHLGDAGGAGAQVPPAEPLTAAALGLLSWLVRFLAVLAGTRNLSVKTRYRYLQPAATLLLLFALAVYGVFLLYAGPDNSNFGANGIADYVPLFLWGFGSDVLTMRLQDITFTRS